MLNNINHLIETLEKEKGIQSYEVLALLQNSIEITINRNVLITNENNLLNIYRINNDGSMTKVNVKSIKKAKNLFKQKLDEAIKKKSMPITLIKNKVYLANVIDITKNGFFLSIKKIKAFLPLANISQKEIVNNNIAIGTQILVEIVHIGKRIIATRKSIEVVKEILYDTFRRRFKVKNLKGRYIIFCEEPYLSDFDMQLLKKVSPINLYFRKIKRSVYA